MNSPLAMESSQVARTAGKAPERLIDPAHWSIRRKLKHERDFVIISNAPLKDIRIGLKAKGLLCYLLSLPKGWKPCAAHLATIGLDGKYSVRTALRELEAAGYAWLETKRGASGRIEGSRWVISEEPRAVAKSRGKIKGPAESQVFRLSGNPTLGKSHPIKERKNEERRKSKERPERAEEDFRQPEMGSEPQEPFAKNFRGEASDAVWRGPGSVREVLWYALSHRQHGLELDPVQLKDWLDRLDLSGWETNAEQRQYFGEGWEPLKSGLYFIFYNNGKGWTLTNSWQAAYDGYIRQVLEKRHQFDKPPQGWVPHIVGPEGDQLYDNELDCIAGW